LHGQDSSRLDLGSALAIRVYASKEDKKGVTIKALAKLLGICVKLAIYVARDRDRQLAGLARGICRATERTMQMSV
jgi:hypothetical protein